MLPPFFRHRLLTAACLLASASGGLSAAPDKVAVTNIRANVDFSDPGYPILLEQNLRKGAPVYSTEASGNRTFQDVGEFAGLQYLRTDTRWWNLETSKRFLEFDIDRDATIYVAYFKKLKDFDKAFTTDHWLADPAGGWKNLRKDIKVTGGGDQAYGVFSKTLKAGRVTLPANAATGLLTGVYAHYLVFIGPPTGQPVASVVPKGIVPGRIPAFPGAEGGGMYATGGRGGEVYEVTNLEDYDPRAKPIPGTFRDAVSKPNRTVVFRVSGTIELKSPLQIKAPNITVAGQTAPGDGIGVWRYPISISGDNKIIRFLRSRPGDEIEKEFDSFGAGFGDQIICDHISVAWSVDEAASFRYVTNFTFQWSIVGESNLHSTHKKGAHGFGGIWGGRNSTYHHNLLLHHVSRMPRFNQGPIDFRNNVFYNWGYKAEYGDYNLANFVGNYYKPGSGTLPGVRDRLAEPLELQSWRGFGMYLNGNVMEGSEAVTKNNLLGASGMDPEKRYILLTKEVPVISPVKTQPAEEAKELVLKFAGASAIPARRDEVDVRYVDEVRTGTGNLIYTRPATIEFAQNEEQRAKVEETLRHHNAKLVKLKSPVLKSTPAPADSDHDGMPDEWETRHGLNPRDPEDRNGDITGDGYTNLEKYLNELAAPAMAGAGQTGAGIVLGPVDLSVLTGRSNPSAIADAEVIVTINGNKLEGAQKPIVKGGRAFVPGKEFLEALGFQVSGGGDKLTATLGGLKLELAPGKCVASPSVGMVASKGVPLAEGGHLYVPVELAEILPGAKTAWDPVNRVAMVAVPAQRPVKP